MAAGAKAKYPERDKFFSHRFCRLLAKMCAAQEIGAHGCWLLTIIVQTEDAKNYRDAVTYWNEQLYPIAGCNNVQALIRLRKRVLASGWLHYEPGTKSVAGRYWVTIPDRFEGIDDLPTDENPDEYRDSFSITTDTQSGVFRITSDMECVGNVIQNAEGMRRECDNLSYRSPSLSLRSGRAGPVFSELTEKHLRDSALLLDWSLRSYPESTGDDLRLIFGAAEHAMTGEKPIRLFVSTVRDKAWGRCSAAELDRGWSRLKSIQQPERSGCGPASLGDVIGKPEPRKDSE